jgi:hypothetical protein
MRAWWAPSKLCGLPKLIHWGPPRPLKYFLSFKPWLIKFIQIYLFLISKWQYDIICLFSIQWWHYNIMRHLQFSRCPTAGGSLKAPGSPGINGVKSCILAISWQQNWPFRNYNLIQKITNFQNLLHAVFFLSFWKQVDCWGEIIYPQDLSMLKFLISYLMFVIDQIKIHRLVFVNPLVHF